MPPKPTDVRTKTESAPPTAREYLCGAPPRIPSPAWLEGRKRPGSPAGGMPIRPPPALTDRERVFGQQSSLVAHRVEPPRPWHTLQFVLAALRKLDTRSGN